MKDITGVICNWKTARMSRGAVLNMQKYYPDLKEIIIGDDGSDKDTMGKQYVRAYNRDAYNSNEKLDLDNSKLKDIPGTRFIEFEDHMGHGFTLDRLVKYVETPLMLTMDSDIRIVGEGLLEEYLMHYNEDPENIYAVGTEFGDRFVGPHGTVGFKWVDPFFSLWNMEPLKRYERLSFTNWIDPASNHYGTAAFLNWQLQYEEMHRPREPYRAVIYPEPEKIPQLWHLRKFRKDEPDSERAKKWEELIDG